MANLRVKDQYTNVLVTDGEIHTTTDAPTDNFRIGDSISQIGVKDGAICVDSQGTLAFNAGVRDLFRVGIDSSGNVIDYNSFINAIRPYFNGSTIQDPSPDYLLRYKLDGTDTSLTRVGGDDFRAGKASPDTIASSFDGSTQYYEADSDVGIMNNIGTGAFTFSFWIKSISADFSSLIDTDGIGNSATSYRVALRTTGTIRFKINSINHDSSSDYNDGKWHLYTFTSSGSGGSYIVYKDSVLDNSGSITTYDINSVLASDIGRSTTGGSDYNGLLDDIRFYNRVLSQSEITALYNYTNDWNELLSTAFSVYDSSRYDTITESAGEVSQWDDLMGNAHLKQTVLVQQPTLNNGAIDMVGATNDILQADVNAGINGSFTVFEIASYGDVLEAVNTLSTIDGSYIRKNTLGNSRNSWATGAENSNFAFTNNVIGVVAHRLDNGVKAEMHINGSFDKSLADPNNIRTVDSPIKTDNSGYAQTIKVYGYWIFQGYISDEELDRVFGLIHWRLGLQSLLPSGHPYKNNPPRA